MVSEDEIRKSLDLDMQSVVLGKKMLSLHRLGQNMYSPSPKIQQLDLE